MSSFIKNFFLVLVNNSGQEGPDDDGDEDDVSAGPVLHAADGRLLCMNDLQDTASVFGHSQHLQL